MYESYLVVVWVVAGKEVVGHLVEHMTAEDMLMAG